MTDRHAMPGGHELPHEVESAIELRRERDDAHLLADAHRSRDRISSAVNSPSRDREPWNRGTLEPGTLQRWETQTFARLGAVVVGIDEVAFEMRRQYASLTFASGALRRARDRREHQASVAGSQAIDVGQKAVTPYRGSRAATSAVASGPSTRRCPRHRARARRRIRARRASRRDRPGSRRPVSPIGLSARCRQCDRRRSGGCRRKAPDRGGRGRRPRAGSLSLRVTRPERSFDTEPRIIASPAPNSGNTCSLRPLERQRDELACGDAKQSRSARSSRRSSPRSIGRRQHQHPGRFLGGNVRSSR